MNCPVISIEKCPIPIVWLDTSMILKLALLKLGKLSDGERPRYQRLHDELYRLTRAGKLLCPEAEQPAEIWAERSKFMDTLYEFSLGVRARPRVLIEEGQVTRLMAGCVSEDKSITLSYADSFSDDPILTAQESLTSGYIVTVDIGFLETVDKIRSQRDTIHSELEAVRQRCVQGKVTYDEQLRLERIDGIEAIISMARDCALKAARNEEPTKSELISYRNICRLANRWELLGGKPPGLEGLIIFLRSPCYASAPCVEISAMLMASLMVGQTPIQHGDSMDVDHISSMLPYVDLLLVDKSMKNRVHALGLDVKYGTLVCYIGDSEDIQAFFQKVDESLNAIVTPLFQEGHDEGRC